MYLTLIGIMFAANITVICPYPCLFNFIRWHHASSWEQLIHETHLNMVRGLCRMQKILTEGFIQWHMVVICIWCALFVTSQF